MDLMKLKATLTLDSKEYEKGLNDSEGKAKAFGGKFAGALKVAKVGAVALGTATIAAVGAVATLTKKSVVAYAEYEQMVGGVKKLYGNMGLSLEDYASSVGKSVDEVSGEYARLEQAQNEVLNNAKQAYKTTGMSATQYMETATSFSAALINSLNGDTVAAARQTDVAMKAISDNWNTFGGDLGMIQQAYQGFAKQNYTMLDNLKLGYGGTKTEMERLIADANEWAAANGKASDLSIDSFSDVVTAIDYIQQKQKIAGTTAREAGTTIAGSLQMTKAAWQNLVTGFADPEADISELMQNLVESVGVAASNLLPAIMRALDGIGKALTTMLPKLVDKIPEAIEKVGEPLISSGAKLVGSLVEGLTKSAPAIITAAFDLVGKLLLGLAQQLPNIIIGGLNLITGLVKGITDGSGSLFSKMGEILLTLVTSLIEAAPQIGAAALELVKAIIIAFASINWFELGKKAFDTVQSGINAVIPLIKNLVRSFVSTILSYLGFSGIGARVSGAFDAVRTAINDKMQAAKNTVSGWIDKIKGMFPFSLGKIFSFSLPSISIGSGSKSVGGKSVSYPTFGVSYKNYAKAMSQPYMFTEATDFMIRRAGEAGDEILYGRSALMRDIAEAAGTNNQDFDIETFASIVGDKIAESLEGMDIILDRRSFGKIQRSTIGASL